MEQFALLEDLDQRQNSVLDRLSELNASIEALLKECLVARDQACQVVDAEQPHERRAPTPSKIDPD
jgi:hypothetical protein